MTSIMPMEGLLLDARNVRNRRISPVAAHSGDRLLSEPTAGTQPCRREPLFMVESECGAVAVGRTYLLPPLSSSVANDPQRKWSADGLADRNFAAKATQRKGLQSRRS